MQWYGLYRQGLDLSLDVTILPWMNV
jgi:hypothetical protein